MRLTFKSRRQLAQLAADTKALRDRIGRCHARIDGLERSVAALATELAAHVAAKPLAAVQPKRVAAKTRSAAAKKPGKA